MAVGDVSPPPTVVSPEEGVCVAVVSGCCSIGGVCTSTTGGLSIGAGDAAGSVGSVTADVDESGVGEDEIRGSTASVAVVGVAASLCSDGSDSGVDCVVVFAAIEEVDVSGGIPIEGEEGVGTTLFAVSVGRASDSVVEAFSASAKGASTRVAGESTVFESEFESEEEDSDSFDFGLGSKVGSKIELESDSEFETGCGEDSAAVVGTETGSGGVVGFESSAGAVEGEEEEGREGEGEGEIGGDIVAAAAAVDRSRVDDDGVGVGVSLGEV